MTTPHDIALEKARDESDDLRKALWNNDARCPQCRLAWGIFMPAKIWREDKYRCIECKFVYEGNLVRSLAAAPSISGGKE